MRADTFHPAGGGGGGGGRHKVDHTHPDFCGFFQEIEDQR